MKYKANIERLHYSNLSAIISARMLYAMSCLFIHFLVDVSWSYIYIETTTDTLLNLMYTIEPECHCQCYLIRSAIYSIPQSNVAIQVESFNAIWMVTVSNFTFELNFSMCFIECFNGSSRFCSKSLKIKIE